MAYALIRDISTAFSSNPYDYDIFLSFRGLDTRKKFTDPLYAALKREGFLVFRDDGEIERGEKNKSELQKAIRNSRMSIIVLSENYANSRACLFELQTILKHSKKSDHLMLPVFYEADPREIKEQAENLDFGKNRVRVEEVKGWRAALKEVASMAGMVSRNQSDGYEVRFVEEIVGVLKSKLFHKHWSVADHLKLDKNMQNLKRKVEYLINQENDINEEIKSVDRQNLKRKVEYLINQENDINEEIKNVDRQPWKRPKREVEVWLRDVQRLKEDVQRLEQEVVAESNVFSRAILGNLIVQKIQEVVELQEKGRVSDDLMINELPSGRLLIPPTECFVESTETRNTQKVWECLMNDDVRRIGVYGMGGVGKTTIMKHIHNQLLEEKANFDMVYWVTVSKAFNFRKLQSDIAKALNLSFGDDEDETRIASELHAALSRNKKYVLILDDLWEAFPLDLVGIPEPTRSNGCKIVLTTRSLEVCRRMNCTPVKVELLTEQEALTLFIRKAVTNDMVLAPEAEVIAAAIVRECACLPLAIVTVAGSLRGLDGTREWRNALNELISLTKEETDAESEVFEQLKFSYSRLGNALLQDCFLYCSLYPEDHSIPVEELIEYWIAEGLIAEMNSVESKFDKGHAILGKLKSSCLLESFTDEAGEEWLSMHPLIRDMALQIARSSPRFMVKAGERLESAPYEDWSDDLDRISFMYSQIRELPSRPPVCPRLTTLLLSYIHLSEIPDSFFINMHRLEVLDLSGNEIQSLPESMSNLENLHALFLVDCRQLKYVPSLEKLKALKVFKLTHSLIEEVPKGLEELVNIRKLDLSNNTRLWTFPSHKLRWLSKLQYLRIDGTGVKVSAEDLLCLRQLKVVAVCFHNVKELAKYGTSQQCQGLEMYCLLVGKIFSDRKLVGKDVCIISKSEPFGSVVDQLVLPVDIDFFQLQGIDDPISLSSIRALKDARDLRSCVVSCCSGLESIFSSSSFSEDSQIFLGTVESFFLSYLPSFRVFYDGITPPCSIYFNLQELCFWKCDIMENIFPVLLLQNFPNLRLLIVIECENVEDIIVEAAEISDWGNLDSKPISLPNLQMLQLTGLPKLKSIYSGMMVCQSIEVVHVQKCPMVRRLPLSLHMDSSQSTPPPSLKCIEVEEEWWDSLEWDDPHAKAILQPFMSRGFQTHAEQNLCAPDLKSRGEKASECLQLLVPQYSDATMSISDSEIPSGTAPKGVLSMEEELSLEELKETPSDPRELEYLNSDPLEVPPTSSHHFSILHKLDLSYTHHFSILHKLDLSYTEINSLPQSISRLVALQILVLRNCELLMELPPEIGELTNLEVLDLEGTEMLCLPKEIAKLVNLTCLKVSFYGYANSRVIPRRVLSSLLRLNELIIEGTPYGEWWDVEVKAIMEAIGSLKELRTLKLYLPTAELLEDLKRIFPGLANFRFTVGRHEEHFISRLPRDVAEEFNNREKLEKGLKYINGSDIPNEITKVLKHANAFFLQRHWTAKSLSEFGHANMIELKFCLVMECNELRTIVDSEQFYRGKDGRGQSEAIVLGSLERLIIRYMKNMETIWKGPVGIGSLSYLKSLALHTCPNLTTLFTIGMFRNLINLEELIVEDCPKIDSLVSLKSSDSKSGLFLPNLKKISLLELPELVSISTGLWIAPKLERMVIYYCPKLEKLSTMDVSSRKLKEIKGEKEWWDALKWYESDLSTEHADYLVRLFIPL